MCTLQRTHVWSTFLMKKRRIWSTQFHNSNRSANSKQKRTNILSVKTLLRVWWKQNVKSVIWLTWCDDFRELNGVRCQVRVDGCYDTLYRSNHPLGEDDARVDCGRTSGTYLGNENSALSHQNYCYTKGKWDRDGSVIFLILWTEVREKMREGDSDWVNECDVWYCFLMTCLKHERSGRDMSCSH